MSFIKKNGKATKAKSTTLYLMGEKYEQNRIFKGIGGEIKPFAAGVITSYSIHYTKLYERRGAGATANSPKIRTLICNTTIKRFFSIC